MTARIALVPMRKLVALFFHLPGLRLFYRAKATEGLIRTNVKAVALTLGAMALAGFTAPPSDRLASVFLVWLIAHFAWGLYLAKMA